MRVICKWVRVVLRWIRRLGCFAGLLLLAAVVLLLLLSERPLAGRTAAAVVIQAPPEQVYEHLVSPPLMQVWQGLQEVEVQPGPLLEEGSRLTLRVLRDDQEVRILEGEVTQSRPPERLALIIRFGNRWGTGWTQLTQYRLLGDGELTRLIVTGDAQYRGAGLRLMEPVITSTAQRRLRDSLRRLKALVETGDASSADQPSAAPASPGG